MNTKFTVQGERKTETEPVKYAVRSEVRFVHHTRDDQKQRQATLNAGRATHRITIAEYKNKYQKSRRQEFIKKRKRLQRAESLFRNTDSESDSGSSEINTSNVNGVGDNQSEISEISLNEVIIPEIPKASQEPKESPLQKLWKECVREETASTPHRQLTNESKHTQPEIQKKVRFIVTQSQQEPKSKSLLGKRSGKQDERKVQSKRNRYQDKSIAADISIKKHLILQKVQKPEVEVASKTTQHKDKSISNDISIGKRLVLQKFQKPEEEVASKTTQLQDTSITIHTSIGKRLVLQNVQEPDKEVPSRTIQNQSKSNTKDNSIRNRVGLQKVHKQDVLTLEYINSLDVKINTRKRLLRKLKAAENARANVILLEQFKHKYKNNK